MTGTQNDPIDMVTDTHMRCHWVLTPLSPGYGLSAFIDHADVTVMLTPAEFARLIRFLSEAVEVK